MNRDGSAAGRRVVAAALVALLLGAGCTPTSESPGRGGNAYGNLPRVTPRPRPTTPAQPKTIEPDQIDLGRSVAGRPLKAQIYGTGEQTILMLATIHGNEQAGTPLLRKLGDYLREHPQIVADKRVILIPVANPDGMASNTRGNLRGIDLNRNFPAWNYSPSRGHGSQPLSEPESRALSQVIAKYEPDRIISLHQPLTCIDYDGPGEALARAMAAATNLPLKKLGSLAGSLGSYAGLTKRIPIVTVEFPRGADDLTPDGLWSRYGRMLLVAVCHPDPVPTLTEQSRRPSPMVSIEPVARPRANRRQTD
ncbi:MAG: DUF2817 domain-containing protein [Planctomycetes bacterium]|nr:DUF2817 domain-containing protein [Planctomycetota bacterium]